MLVHARPYRSLSWLIIVCLVAGTLVLASPDTAHSHHEACPPAGNEDQLAAWDSCRNFVMDPGHRLMNRDDLIHAAPLYTSSVGNFSMNFLWYSVEKTVTVASPSTLWTTCKPFSHPGTGNYCDPANIVSAYNGGLPHGAGGGTVLHTFFDIPSVDLSVFEYGGGWIAKVCGNWLDVAERPKPVPTITIEKFRDDNGDKGRSGVEPGLGEWQFVITPKARTYGGSTAPVTLTTNAQGEAVFRLDGYGPGTYEIKEILQNGWEATTGAVREVSINPGIGAKDHRISFGNRRVADAAKTDITVVGPAEMMVGVASELTVDVTVANLGPSSSVEVSDSLSIEMPEDCVAGLPVQSATASLAAGTPQTFRFVYSVTCNQPSFHDFLFLDELKVVEPGVHDPDTSNNTMQDAIRIPVIAQADLAIVDPVLLCDRPGPADPYSCDLSVEITNQGPFGPVNATAALDFSAPEECEVVGSSEGVAIAGLGAGTTRGITGSWTVECDPITEVRSFSVDLQVTADDIHVRNVDDADNRARILHTDADIKPNSDPNSLNMKQKGVTAVAILSSGNFDATTLVIQDTIRFGRTGTEAVALRCASEDSNSDGRVDLVCHFRVADTGFVDGDVQGLLTAMLVDGSSLFATDSVRILHG